MVVVASFLSIVQFTGLFQYQVKAEPVLVPPPPPVTAVIATTTTEQVFFPRSIIYQSKTDPIAVPSADVVTVDRWFEPLSEPVRRKPFINQQDNNLSLYEATNPVNIVYVPYSLDTNISYSRQWQYQVQTEPQPIDPADTVYVPSGGNVSVKLKRPWQYQIKTDPIAVPAAPVVTDNKWYQAWSEPVRRKPFINQQDNNPPLFEATNPVNTVYVPLGGNVSVKFKRLWQYQIKTDPIAVTPAEVITEDKWHQAWSEPVRVKPKVVFQQPLSWCPQTIAPETITEDKWHQAWSLPVRVKPKVVFQQSLAWCPQTIVPEVVTQDKWYQAWSLPVRTRPKLASQQSIAWSRFTPATVAAVEPATLTSSVIFKQSIPYQTIAWCPQPITPSSLTYFGMVEGDTGLIFRKSIIYQVNAQPLQADVPDYAWHQPWSEPVRAKRGLGARYQQTLAWSGFTPPVVPHIPAIEPTTITSQVIFKRSIPYQTIAWCPQTIVPPTFRYFNMAEGDTGLIFQKTIIYQESAQAESSETNVLWYQPLSEPVRQKGGLRAYLQPQLAWSRFTPSVTPTVPAVEPTTFTSQVIFGRSIQYQSLARCPTPPEVITEDKWHQAWSQPVRVRRLATAQQQAHFAPAATIPRIEAIEPTISGSAVIFKRSIPYQTITWCPQTIAPPTFVYFNMAEGDTGLIFQKTIIYQESALAGSPEINTLWYAPFSEPVRQKAGLKTYLQQEPAWSTFTPADVTPMVEPTTIASSVIFQRSIPYQTIAWCPQTISAETITEDKWHQAWSQPVRIKPKVVFQQDLAWAPQTITPEVITEDKWHQPWSIPVRVKPKVVFQQDLAWAPQTITPEVTTEDKWHQAWSEPVRAKPKIVFQQDLAWAPQTITPEVTTEDKWHQPWADPVRKKPGLGTWEQRDLFWSGFTPFITEDQWHQAWSEPVRVKPKVAFQQDLAFTPQQPEAITEDKWHQAWSIPVKLKYQFRTDLQQAFTAAPADPNFIRTINWYAPLSEPVRLKVGLGARFQQFFGTDTKLPPVPPAFLTLNATETNNDTAFFAISVIYSRPVRAWVSIKEVPRNDDAYVSIEET